MPCLDLTSPEFYQICLDYVCNLHFHNTKHLAIFSSQSARNKTHICDYLCHWLNEYEFLVGKKQSQFTLLCS